MFVNFLFSFLRYKNYWHPYLNADLVLFSNSLHPVFFVAVVLKNIGTPISILTLCDNNLKYSTHDVFESGVVFNQLRCFLHVRNNLVVECVAFILRPNKKNVKKNVVN